MADIGEIEELVGRWMEAFAAFSKVDDEARAAGLAITVKQHTNGKTVEVAWNLSVEDIGEKK